MTLKYDDKGYAKGGALVKGWMDLGSSKYWFGEDCRMATGWTDVVVSGKVMHYYFNPASGNLVRGTWFQIDGTTYYFRPSGNLATGFADVPEDSFKRCFDSEGRMLVGWQEIGGNRYYFRASGAMQTGEATIGGKSYMFSGEGVLVE